MFVYSVRASTIKFFAVLCIASLALVAVIFTIPVSDVSAEEVMAKTSTNISFENIKTNEDRIEFLKQFGWEVNSKPINESEVKIPVKLDTILETYNNIQTTQGLDISKFTGKTVNRYTYQVTNYPDYDGTVYANIIVYKNKVIAGDLCSSDINGFIHGLEKEAVLEEETKE